MTRRSSAGPRRARVNYLLTGDQRSRARSSAGSHPTIAAPPGREKGPSSRHGYATTRNSPAVTSTCIPMNGFPCCRVRAHDRGAPSHSSAASGRSRGRRGPAPKAAWAMSSRLEETLASPIDSGHCPTPARREGAVQSRRAVARLVPRCESPAQRERDDAYSPVFQPNRTLFPFPCVARSTRPVRRAVGRHAGPYRSTI